MQAGLNLANLSAVYRHFIGDAGEISSLVQLLSCALLREPDHRARRILGLFARQTTIRSAYVAGILGVSRRQAHYLLADWLVVADPSGRGRKFA